MKKMIVSLLLLLCVSLSSSFAQTTLFDFENGKAMDGWGNSSKIVTNAWSNSVNSSSKCFEITFSELWGRVSSDVSIDLTKNGVSFLAYSESLGDISVYVDDKGNYPQVSQSILTAKQWVRVYFDFSGLASSATQIQIGTGALNTIYIDDVQTVPISQFPASKCTGKMDVAYKYGTVAVGGGGFVSGLVASPKDKNVKFARTDVGGAYKWNAADCSWKPITNFVSAADKGLLSVESLTLDPSNSNNVYLLGGCMYFSGEKTAIMYSKDGGANFTTIDVSNLIKAHGNGNGRGNGERLAVDPNNSNILLCGGRAGSPLITSTDGGKSWSKVATFPSATYSTTTKWPVYDTWTPNPTMWPTTPNLNGTSAVVFDASSKASGKTQRIFVGISRIGSSNVYVSENAGTTWSAVSGLPTNMMPLRMKMDPNGKLLITYSDKEGPNNCGTTGGIYRYDPATKLAQNISPPGGHPIGDVSTSRTSGDSLVCTTICTWVPQKWDTGNSPNGDIIFTSTDGGKNWRSLQNNCKFDSNGCSWIPDHAIHWSCSILMDPFDNNKVSVTSGNGIFTTNNVWCTAAGGPTFYFDVNGLEETVPLDLVSIPGGDLYSVIGDYTGFRHKDIHAFAPIHKPESGTTGGIAYAGLNTKILARVGIDHSYYTENGGTTWTRMTGAAQPADASDSEVAISADGTTIVYKNGSTSTLTYSTNKGATFSASNGAQSVGYIIADPVNANYFYAAAKNKIYISSDKGKNFSATTLANSDFTRICVVPGHEGVIYSPMGGSGLNVSTNHGQSFTAVPNVTNCEAVGVGKGLTAGSYLLYIWGKANGCEVGLYRSANLGANWERINDETTQFGGVGNGAFVVGDQNVYGRFYMGTVGLGIVYGEPEENATSSHWSCFVDNTDCKPDNTATTKTLNIDLVAGWNLISTNVSIADSSIATLFHGLDVSEIKTMDVFWNATQPAYLNSLISIAAGEGYFVRMNKSGKLSLTGEPISTSIQYDGISDWMLIGCPFQIATPVAGVLGTNYSELKDFDGYNIPNDPKSSLDKFVPGKGYFLKK